MVVIDTGVVYLLFVESMPASLHHAGLPISALNAHSLEGSTMKTDIYDTYATSSKGETIHFDVLVPSETSADEAYRFACQWLQKIGQTDAELKQEKCKFCHSETANEAVIADIGRDGYHIIQMDGCPNPL